MIHRSLLLLALAAVLGGCANKSPVPPEAIGRVYTYVRSNQDGSNPDAMHQHYGTHSNASAMPPGGVEFVSPGSTLSHIDRRSCR